MTLRAVRDPLVPRDSGPNASAKNLRLFQMSILNRGAVASTSLMCVGSCLLIILVDLSAFPTRSGAQSTPTPAARPLSDGSRPPRSDPTKSDHPRSIQLYRTHCTDCHDGDGRGESSRDLMRTIPDFTKPDWHIARSNDRLLRSIREGKGFMPAMKDKLGATEVVELVGLVRHFRDGRQVVPDEPTEEDDRSIPPEPEESKTLTSAGTETPRVTSLAATDLANRGADDARNLFRRFCVSCHGADGRGIALRAQVPRLPDFASAVWHEQRTDAELTVSIFEGKGTTMPTFRGKLDEAQVSNLIAHLRSMAPSRNRIMQKPLTNFRRRFEELRTEMNDLQRQYRALSSE